MNYISLVVLIIFSVNVYGQTRCDKGQMQKELISYIHQQDSKIKDSIYIAQIHNFQELEKDKNGNGITRTDWIIYVKKGAIIRFYVNTVNCEFEINLYSLPVKTLLKKIENKNPGTSIFYYDYVISDHKEFHVEYICKKHTSNCLVMGHTVIDRATK